MFRNSWTLSKVLPLPRSVSNGVTVTGEKMPFVSECGASFAKFGDLSKHVKTHFGARPFPCLECGSTFTASSHLKSHMTIHSGEKPFSCKDCDATFARPCQQKSHTMRRHTSLMTRPYPCSQCSSAFLTRWELKEQQQIHSGTKSFTCRACSVTFSCPSYLKRHALRTHTPVNTRPYQCSACSTTFRSSYELKRHEKEHTLGRLSRSSVASAVRFSPSPAVCRATSRDGTAPATHAHFPAASARPPSSPALT